MFTALFGGGDQAATGGDAKGAAAAAPAAGAWSMGVAAAPEKKEEGADDHLQETNDEDRPPLDSMGYYKTAQQMEDYIGESLEYPEKEPKAIIELKHVEDEMKKLEQQKTVDSSNWANVEQEFEKCLSSTLDSDPKGGKEPLTPAAIDRIALRLREDPALQLSDDDDFEMDVNPSEKVRASLYKRYKKIKTSSAALDDTRARLIDQKRGKLRVTEREEAKFEAWRQM
mmetsp:Transcript_93759/g.214509  ORF Transcript_93759/g.214509 Transcript_93759/m.214509 type:complete len:227 (-) Transcript_93759:55-735(-)